MPMRIIATRAAGIDANAATNRRGAAHNATPMPKSRDNLPRCASTSATMLPIRPPTPNAALRTPTPLSDISSRSSAIVTSYTAEHPATIVCATYSATIRLEIPGTEDDAVAIGDTCRTFPPSLASAVRCRRRECRLGGSVDRELRERLDVIRRLDHHGGGPYAEHHHRRPDERQRVEGEHRTDVGHRQQQSGDHGADEESEAVDRARRNVRRGQLRRIPRKTRQECGLRRPKGQARRRRPAPTTRTPAWPARPRR